MAAPLLVAPSSQGTSTPSSDSPPSSAPPSPTTPQSKTFYAKAKRRFSAHRASVSLPSLSSLPSINNLRAEVSTHLPKLFSSSESETPSWANSSIAPPTHRENTALHALMDSLPVMPTLSARSLPSFSFNTPSMPSIFCMTPNDSGSSEEDEAAQHGEKDVKNDPLKRLTGNIVVLGGYRGSILRDAKTLKRIWIPLRVGFGLRKPDLAIGLTDEDELRSTETVVPGRMLMAVGGVIDLGKRLKDKLKYLSSLPAPPPDPTDSLARPVAKLNFTSWGYDWRRRLELSSELLLRDLERMKAESKARGEGKDGEGEGATVIAHSMGGLVTLHALARAEDPTVFKGIIFAGTPFHGCVNVLSPFRRGDGVLFNREICSPRVVFSMRSSYYFLPLDHACFETPDGTPLPVDFYDTKSWSDLNLSPIAGYLFDEGKERQRRENREEAERAEDVVGVAGVMEPSMGGEEDSDGREDEVALPEVQEEQEGVPQRPKHPRRTTTVEEGKTEDKKIAAYLAKTLERVKIFHAELTSFYDPARAAMYPPMVMLTSRKTPTVRGVITPSYNTIAPHFYDHLLYGEGDGIVLYDSANSLPGGPDRWNRHLVGVEESTHGHVSLLGDLDAVRRCLAKLYG